MAEEHKVVQDKAGRAGFEDLLTRRAFVIPAFEIYGGIAGLYDYGPAGSATFNNLVQYWRQHFVLTEEMVEISCTSVTPEAVLKTSGHVDRFTDLMVQDTKTSDCFRADKLVEEFIDKKLEAEAAKLSDEEKLELEDIRTKVGAYLAPAMKECIARLKIKSPSGNDLSDPYPFNLMFKTEIGPTGKLTGYLRPETAQGIFVNFRRLLDYNGGRMPFAAAQIGSAFRNEIAPRSGLLRVREFTLAEIEHFVNPNDKSHPKFQDIKDIKLSLYSRAIQEENKQAIAMTVGDAVASGIINNQTLGYFMARTHLFLLAIGVKEQNIRFRQHLSDEMAHYAQDCWDAEIRNSYGWIECVGHADRACYDLEMHSKVSKVDLVANEVYETPKVIDAIVVKVDAGKLGRGFRGDAKEVRGHLESLSKNRDKAVTFAEELKSGSATVKLCTGKEYTVTADMVSITFEQQTVHSERYTPGVIEPSFGLGRIFYSLLEQSYYVREGNSQRAVLALPPLIAPFKCSIFPLSRDDKLIAMANEIAKRFIPFNLATKTDSTGATVGKRYARTDELGCPFAITVDFESIEQKTVTLRERDSCVQIRLPESEVVALVAQLVAGSTTWRQCLAKYPQISRDESDD